MRRIQLLVCLVTPAAIVAAAISGCTPRIDPFAAANTTVSANTTAPAPLAVKRPTTERPQEAVSPENVATVAPQDRPPRRSTRSTEEQIEQALAEPAELDFVDTSLPEVVEFLRERYDINVVIDRQALYDVGVGLDTPMVTIKLSNVSLRSALDLMLGQLALARTIGGDVLLITTEEEAESVVVPKIYDVTELVTCSDENGQLGEDDFDSLTEMIASTIAPTSWEGCGPVSMPGMRIGEARILIISQTYQVHYQVAELLKQLKSIARRHAAIASQGKTLEKRRE